MSLEARRLRRQCLQHQQRSARVVGKIRVGVGGWTYEPWRDGVFHPAGLPVKQELAYLSGKTTTLELLVGVKHLPCSQQVLEAGPLQRDVVP